MEKVDGCGAARSPCGASSHGCLHGVRRMHCESHAIHDAWSQAPRCSAMPSNTQKEGITLLPFLPLFRCLCFLQQECGIHRGGHVVRATKVPPYHVIEHTSARNHLNTHKKACLMQHSRGSFSDLHVHILALAPSTHLHRARLVLMRVVCME
eukprot:673107-Pelagomonas_calceolata.AAC.10